MADDEGDVEYEFEGNPECPLCGALAGTTDSRPIPPPHENCQCSSVATCNNTYDVSGTSHRYGPQGDCFTFEAEITVTCWNGTEVGMTLPIDFGCVGADQEEGFIDAVWDAAADAAAGMAEGCPDCNTPVA